MLLRTLGSPSLEGTDLKRPKLLTLLAYLALEGPAQRGHLADLFYLHTQDPRDSLATALRNLRRDAQGTIDTDGDHVSTRVPCDANSLIEMLEAGRHQQAVDTYRGRFLEGLNLNLGEELEEWLYTTREQLAARIREALLTLAEREASQGQFQAAAKRAEQAYFLAGAPEPEAKHFERLFSLLTAGESLRAEEVRKEGEGFGLTLTLTRGEARSQLLRQSTREDSARHNLPQRATRFVGREEERGKLGELLAEPSCRLLTTVGPGGIGKTRLAIEVARDQRESFPDGVVFAPLVALTGAASLPTVVAGALGLTLSGQEDARSVVKRFLAEKRLLLVLDNFEHLLEGTSFVRELIDHCPGLKLLVTSRERLNLQHEWVFTLEGLAYPEEGTTLGGAESFDAVQLFLQRARQAHHGFSLTADVPPAVMRICQLVAGMPLAIELASSWLRALPAGDIVRELERGIDLLESPVRDVPGRHRSVRAVFDHSWTLLSVEEREVLRRLSVFRGGFRREAAAVVAGASLPVLARLVDTSLLRMSTEGRYDRHPLLAQYTREKLAGRPEEKAEAEQKHGSYYLGLVRDTRTRPVDARA